MYRIAAGELVTSALLKRVPTHAQAIVDLALVTVATHVVRVDTRRHDVHLRCVQCCFRVPANVGHNTIRGRQERLEHVLAHDLALYV